jgi:hypothetical protein
MTIDEFSAMLVQCERNVRPFAPAALAEFFGLAERHFRETDPEGPIQFCGALDGEPACRLLRGAIFWPSTTGAQQIVRGHPRVFPTSDYTTDRAQTVSELRLAACALESGELVVEPKLHGETIRVYKHGGDLYAATDVAYDGGNPLVGAGIDNSHLLGVDYASQAARIVDERYRRLDRLVTLGYTAVFVLQIPELAPDRSVDRAELVLVDVIDPEFAFVDRLEKERIAEDFDLAVVDLVSRITLTSAEPFQLVRRLRALEHQQPRPGSGGYIVKGRTHEDFDQLFCKVEPSSERDRARHIGPNDLAAVTEEITGQFGDEIWTDPLFAEEVMLEYLGTRHRSARWRVAAYLESWTNARRQAGLA